jgi:ABC-type transporter Mla subunit MlaD
MTDAAPPRLDLNAELARLEQLVGILRARATEAHAAFVNADAILRATVQRRDEVAAQLRLAGTTWSTASAPPVAGTAARLTVRGGAAQATRTAEPLFILGGSSHRRDRLTAV